MSIRLAIPKLWVRTVTEFFQRHAMLITVILLCLISIVCFLHFYQNGLGLAYNDARSRLNIGRRVVEGLKPGIAQLGSVWLPLPHILMIPTIWNEFFWHSGLSGSLQSMAAFVLTGIVIYLILDRLGVDLLGKVFGVFVFAANLNVLYLQSTSMTELLLLATMTIGSYEFVKWYDSDKLVYLIRAAFWIMLSTLIRYDGWFLFFCAAMLVVLKVLWQTKWNPLKAWKKSEGMFILFCTLGGLGIGLWFLWNLAIFGDPLYFAFGEFSAHTQQSQLEEAGVLQSKGDWGLSSLIYGYALAYNSVTTTVILGMLGALALWTDRRLSSFRKVGLLVLLAPLIFNILALYLGHSVLFVQGLSGESWFNVRYGLMMMPSIAVFAGYLVHRFKPLRLSIIGIFLFITLFHFLTWDSVTIDDGRVGSSQKNVSEVSGWLQEYAAEEDGFVLISAASHDAIIFSSRMPMKRFIHEGTGKYWESATTSPDRWARWIVMRTNDKNDLTFRTLDEVEWESKYTLVDSYPFADIYQLKDEFVSTLNTQPVLGKQK
jgi:hypothetical protein